MMRRSTRVVSAIVAMTCCASANAAMAVQAKLEWRALDDTPKDASCKAVRFEHPHALAIDQIGNIYVGNEKGNSAIQKISTDGTISTLLDRRSPNLHGRDYVDLSLAIDSMGRIFVGVGGRRTIEELNEDGTLKLLAGQPGDKGMVDGPAEKAKFNAIAAVAVGPDEEIYIADSRTIRKLSTEGTVSTIAGDEHAKADYQDGQGRATAFGYPRGLVVDQSKNIFVADGSYRHSDGPRFSSFGLLRKISPSGMVTSIAGSIDAEGDVLDGQGTGAMFTELFGIAFDIAQDLFVTEEQNELRVAIRKISPTLKVTTIMSARALASFEKDRDGLEPALYTPSGISVDPFGKVYFADTGGNKLHRIDKFEVTRDYAQEDIPAYMTTLCAVQNSATAP